MKKILITGGAGFMGYHLTRKLIKKYQVDIADNFSRGGKDKDFLNLLKYNNVKLFNLDLIKNHNKIQKLSKNYHYIFHFAAVVGVSNVINSPYGVLVKNFKLLQNAIDIAKKQKKLKRFIFSSSSEVYFGTLKNYGLTFPTKENTKLSILSLSDKRGTYMLSKIYGEALCEQANIPFTIVRPHNFYGPRMGASHVIPELFKKVYLSKNKKLDVFSPKHRRNFCYIDDGLDLILSLISKKKSLNNTYNIGNKSKDITIEKLSKIIIKISKKDLKIKRKRDIFNSPQRRWPDVSKALKITSYKFKYDLKRGLLKTHEWYKSNIFKH